MKLRKTIRQVHGVLGLVSGLVVFIVSVTGCLYVFKAELEPLLYGKHYFHAMSSKEPLPLSEVHNRTRNALPDSLEIRNIVYYNQSSRTVEFSVWEESIEPSIWYWKGDKYYFNAYSNPVTGELVKLKNMNAEFFYIVFQLHWSLLLKESIGQPIVGVSVIIFVLLLISGLVLWWPRQNKDLRQRWRFDWKKSTKWKRKNFDLHSISGFYAFIILLLIAITGLFWAFDWFSQGTQSLANTLIPKKSEERYLALAAPKNLDDLDRVLYEVKEHSPHAYSYRINLPQSKKEPVIVIAQLSPMLNYDRIVYSIDLKNERIRMQSFSEKSSGEQIAAINYDLHVGSILGLPGKILAFFASLVSASLPVTGFMIWWGRRKKGKKQKTKSSLNKEILKNKDADLITDFTNMQ